MSEHTGENDAAIRHRVFGRCADCGRDAARWEDGQDWWHLDNHVQHDHRVIPPVMGNTDG
jgi:hypothetical protein